MIDLNDDRDILILDGDCGLCHRLTIFIDKRLTKKHEIKYRPIESEEAKVIISSLTKKHQEADTVYLIRDGKSYIRSAAGIRTLLYLKWYYAMWFPILWLIPLPLRDLGYRVIAKYRHRFFKRPDVCLFRVD